MCRHSLAGSKQGKSRVCSRSGSKQQRRQERHFLVPTSHVAVQAARRGPDCPGHCGIATPGWPGHGDGMGAERVGSREHQHS